MATQATTTTSTHLLTPLRVDQLVREHLDPPDYPSYPAQLIDQYEAICQERDNEIPAHSARLAARGINQLDNPTHPDVVAHHTWLAGIDASTARLEHEIAARLSARRIALQHLYRELSPVAAERDRSGGDTRYLSAQQWLWHVRETAMSISRTDKRSNVIAVAEALAEHARSDGVFLAGVVDVQRARGIAASTWTRAYSWLVDAGLARTLSEQRLLTQLERALAIGSERHNHVHRWRAVIQLQHTSARTLKPTKWVPPVRSTESKNPLDMKVNSTSLRPVDNGAARRFGAASPRPTTKKPRAWRSFHPATVTLYKLVVSLAERLTGYLPSDHPLVVRLGAQLTPQRIEVCHAIRSASPMRLMPHLDRLARAGCDPAGLLVAIEDAEHRSGRYVHHRTWDPNRRLIAALHALDPSDILDLAGH